MTTEDFIPKPRKGKPKNTADMRRKVMDQMAVGDVFDLPPEMRHVVRNDVYQFHKKTKKRFTCEQDGKDYICTRVA